MSQRSGSLSNISGKPSENREKFDIRPQDYAALAVISFDQERSAVPLPELKVQMMARAMYPEVKINRQNFNFGEC